VTNNAIKQLTGASLPRRCWTGPSPSCPSGGPAGRDVPPVVQGQRDGGATPTETQLDGFIDVTELNKVLQAAGKPAVDAAGLDKAQR